MTLLFTHGARRYCSDPQALAAWLNLASMQATQVQCNAFDKQSLNDLMPELRPLSRQEPQCFFPELVRRCATAGVAVVVVPALDGCRASSAAVMLSPRKAMLALSIRYKRDDHFWFSFFAAAAAVAHGLVASEESQGTPAARARDLLIPPDAADELPSLTDPQSVEAFAERVSIAPGIIVGRMQHDGLINWDQMNALKRSVDLSWVLASQGAVSATWQTVTESAQQLLHDISDLALPHARARVSVASKRGFVVGNGRAKFQHRIEPVSFAAWRLQQRLRDLRRGERNESQESRDSLAEVTDGEAVDASPVRGPWILHVHQLADRGTAVAQALARRRRCALPDALAAVQRGTIASGTMREMQQLQEHIQRTCGIRPALVRRTEAA